MTNSIRTRRLALNVTQDQLSTAAGVAQQSLSQIERGIVPMPRAERAILAVLDALEAKGQNES
jgi:transcriptional regulator with XRE-family HTH domain